MLKQINVISGVKEPILAYGCPRNDDCYYCDLKDYCRSCDAMDFCISSDT
ncbi:freyrasin family ranthipeptide [Paenibacillus kribbensis]